MKKFSQLTLIALTFSSCLAFAGSEFVVDVGNSCLNLRSQGSSRSNVKSCLNSGTKVQILKRSGRYSLVQVGNKKGYVYNRYLDSVTEPPVITTAALATPTLVTRPNLKNEWSTDRFSENKIDLTGQKTLPLEAADRATSSLSSSESSSNTNLAPAKSTTTAGDLAALSWEATRTVQKDVIGTGHGYTLSKPVGWAKISLDGSIDLKGSQRSHCTSATHAHFLTMIGELNKKGLIRLNSSSVEALNSELFRDAWNSNGYANGKIMELLGGQSFTDKSLVKKGDFMKIDRRNGSGHTTIFSHFEGNKVCFWSANKSTRGPGVKCESMSGSRFTFSRINDLAGLQAGLDNLGNELASDRAFADVRRRGGNGDVKNSTLEIASAENLKSSPALINSTELASSAKKIERRFAEAGIF